MEIIGTMYKILQQEEVTLGDGTKKMKGGFVIMRDGEFAKPVAFELFGDDRIALLNGLNVGMPVKVNFIAVSFEGKNGGYYTTLRCTNVFPLVTGISTPVSQVGTASSDFATNSTSDSVPRIQPNAELSPDEALPFDNDLPFF